MQTYFELEAGTVTTRIENDKMEFLIIYRKKSGDFSLPKGHLEAGESLEETAIRETHEETGYEVKLIDFIGSFEYKLEREKDGKNIYIIRRPYIFYAEVSGGSSNGQNIDENEGDMKVFWMSYEEAKEKLTYFKYKEYIEEIYNKYQKSLK